MAIHGNLATMTVSELLQWAGGNGKTGLLRLEQDGVATKLFFEDGRVTGCISDDPPYLLGQFLLFRGAISEELLRDAMSEQQCTGRSLSDALVDRDVISREELDREVAAKAEETILSLFHWSESEAMFWFRENTRPGAKAMRVDLDVSALLLRGATRLEELDRVRRVFARKGIVPARQSEDFDPEEIEDFPSRQIYLAVDGERSVEEIALFVHGTEFQVARRLLTLQRRGVITLGEADAIAGSEPDAVVERVLLDLDGGDDELETPAGFERREAAQSVEAESLELVLDDPEGRSASTPAERLDGAEAKEDGSSHEFSLDLEGLQPEPGAVEPEPELVDEAEAEEASEEVESHLQKAREHVDHSDHEAALDQLDQAREVDPGHPSISTIRSGAEAALVQRFLSDGLTPNRVPVVVASPETVADSETTPAQDYLLKQANGEWDIQSLLSVAPLRPVELLSALHGLVMRGLVELRAPSE